jgi:hypothetical protein
MLIYCWVVCLFQCGDSNCFGYSYDGLSDEERQVMALWRVLIEGLADGIKSKVKNSSNGVGCLIQRSSVLALRAILVRHGHLFSIEQLVAILAQTLLPAIQAGAEYDQTPVIDIVSESPTVSSIDFLVDPLPAPPADDDEGLLRFEALNRYVRFMTKFGSTLAT